MKTSQKQVPGILIRSAAYSVEKRPRLLLEHPEQRYIPTPANKSLTCKQNKTDSVLKRMNKLGKTADKFAHGIREHVKLGTRITETLIGKLSLGARIIQVGGVKKVFRQLFGVSEGERLLRVCQCYLSTTAGPIAGLLFTSTEKIAFCSERSIKLSSPEGKLMRIHYKVVIPLRKIMTASQRENVKKPSEKYIEVVTVDDFDFWFMGFFSYQKAFKSCIHDGRNLGARVYSLRHQRFQFFSSRIFIGEPDTHLDHGVTAVGNKVSKRNKVLVGEELVWCVMQRNVSAKEGLNVIAMRSSYTPLSDVSISQQMPPQLTLCFYHLSERENSLSVISSYDE
ncbi:hypothetical protein OIU78_020798 [Salix suchowensis]|nr:hypothetical protein OIU78_020798 [Salix suchowensis]